MSGETRLDLLLATLCPVKMKGKYIFTTKPDARYGSFPELEPIAAFQETEGLTMVVPKSKADEHRVNYESVFQGITLQVHSSLVAVGLTAAFASKLAEYDISANVIAGYYHDHIFVQSEKVDEAIAALKELSRDSQNS